MKKKSRLLKIACILVSLAVLIASVPLISVNASASTASFAVLSDIHYLSSELYAQGSEAWNQYLETSERQMEEADAILENAFEIAEVTLQEAKENNSAYVLIPGDITKDGEYLSHVAMAEKFRAFEEETGIPVFVIPGNHDVNNSNAADYTGEEAAKARITTPEEFSSIYADFGYNEALARYQPEGEGAYGGSLSYTALLEGGYLLLAIDSCMYSEDNGAEGNEHVTGGRIGDGLMQWIVEQCDYAEENNLRIVTMQHHNLIPHIEIEEATLFAFVVEDWQRICDFYADNGIHYVFTGHLHAQDTASYVSDNGETVTDILTSTLTGFPNKLRSAVFTYDDSSFDCEVDTHEIDEIRNVEYILNGEKIECPAPFKFAYSYANTFGKTVDDFAMGAVKGLVYDYFPEIREAGGLIAFLAEMGVDLEKIIVDALGTNGLALGKVEILTVSQNLMGFINDLGAQVDAKYINNEEYTLDFVSGIIDKLLSLELSEYPCTDFYDEMGYGDPARPGNLRDFAQCCIAYYYNGDEPGDSEFMLDVLEGFESGELAEKLFNLLREVLVDDLILGEILGSLEFNPGELFPEGSMLRVLGLILQGVTEALLGGNNSYTNLVESVLGIPLVPEEYSSVNSIIDTLMNEYITQSQFEAWGHTISWMLSSFVVDVNPEVGADNDVTLSYTGPVEVEVTQDNYRLPSHLVMTLSEDAQTGANITWLTKYSITASDIQIIPYSENPDFDGTANVRCSIDADYEIVEKAYPGADIGLVMGILEYYTEYARHNVKITGLTPGTKYSYRVGDAERGWWSEAGTIETADGSDSFTFINVTDMQSQNAKQYETVAGVLDTAFDLYPDAKFVVSNGDQVDMGNHLKHWRYFLNGSGDTLRNTYFMPTAGNHEDEKSVLVSNFIIPNIAESSNTEIGGYYSYDYNNCHFTVLDTNDIVDDELSAEQIEWLKDDVSSSEAKWKIVVLHKAAYSNGSHYDDGDVVGIRKQLCTLMPYLGVDMVLQGHDHVYLRTDVMNANFAVPCEEKQVTHNGLDYTAKVNPNGTVYSIPGTSGVKVYKTKDSAETDKLFPRAEAVIDVDSQVFTAITVDGDYLYYDAYEVTDGKAQRIDSFAIEKTDDSAPADSPVSSVFEKIIEFFDFSRIWKILVTVFPFIAKLHAAAM
ncbi:MAG: metallophosphoesterase [Clostridia bacterium]|nr:metallophosphoesterase [Clostridia bacterium]